MATNSRRRKCLGMGSEIRFCARALCGRNWFARSKNYGTPAIRDRYGNQCIVFGLFPIAVQPSGLFFPYIRALDHTGVDYHRGIVDTTRPASRTLCRFSSERRASRNRNAKGRYDNAARRALSGTSELGLFFSRFSAKTECSYGHDCLGYDYDMHYRTPMVDFL